MLSAMIMPDRRTLLGGLLLLPSWARAQSAPGAVVEAFNNTLLAVMRDARRLGIRGREQRLRPAMEAAFNLPAMARISVGPPWTQIAAQDQQAIVQAFSDWSIATFANRFDNFSGERFVIDDLLAGRFEGGVDDVVLRRNDGVPAYNLAVVVDDAAQRISHVLRGDDLLTSTPRQRLLQDLLTLPRPTYAHLPLVLAPDGSRLAKRHGAVTLQDLAERGVSPTGALARLGASLGLCSPFDSVTIADLAVDFQLETLPRTPWQLQSTDL